MSDIKKQIRSFVVERFLLGEDGVELTDDASFLETGVVDSTGVLEMVTYLEETFGIKVEDDELIPENLDSITNLSAYVERKTCAEPAGDAPAPALG